MYIRHNSQQYLFMYIIFGIIDNNIPICILYSAQFTTVFLYVYNKLDDDIQLESCSQTSSPLLFV